MDEETNRGVALISTRYQYQVYCYRFFAKKQEIITGLFSSGIRCYPFRGAPDITIKTRAAIISEGDDDDQYVSTSEDDVVENKLQCEKQSTSDPPKLGELFAQMNIMHVQKCLSTVIKKDDVEKFKAKKYVSYI